MAGGWRLFCPGALAEGFNSSEFRFGVFRGLRRRGGGCVAGGIADYAAENTGWRGRSQYPGVISHTFPQFRENPLARRIRIARAGLERPRQAAAVPIPPCVKLIQSSALEAAISIKITHGGIGSVKFLGLQHILCVSSKKRQSRFTNRESLSFRDTKSMLRELRGLRVRFRLRGLRALRVIFFRLGLRAARNDSHRVRLRLRRREQVFQRVGGGVQMETFAVP